MNDGHSCDGTASAIACQTRPMHILPQISSACTWPRSTCPVPTKARCTRAAWPLRSVQPRRHRMLVQSKGGYGGHDGLRWAAVSTPIT